MAHCGSVLARKTVIFSRTADFVALHASPPKKPDLYPRDYQIWELKCERVRWPYNLSSVFEARVFETTSRWHMPHGQACRKKDHWRNC